MLHLPPPRECLERLVPAAMRVRAATPWRRINDDTFFGVREPLHGTLGLVGVSGQVGGSKGITVYPGVSGYTTLVRATHGLLPEDRFEALLEMHSLSCSFVPWSQLAAEERRFLKDAGMSIGSDSDVPRFVCFRPGYLPGPPDAGEAEFLATVLEQTLYVLHELSLDRHLLAEHPPGSYRTRVCAIKDGGKSWGWEWARFDVLRPPMPAPWEPDEFTATRLRRLPMAPEQVWEVAAVPGAGVLRETSRTRPELLLALMIAVRGSGRVLSAEALPAPSFGAEAGRCFAQRLLKLGMCPHHILVHHYGLRDLLAPVVKPLGSKLLRVQYLPALEAASEDMLDHLARDTKH